ncbi:MAG: UDP-N-acetylglucosamine 1-carboxyvinyltransferase [Alphaproteobacteria bacterium]|nr:UDP-N-acetylglucosamine 1-carboxyvinyltransferase [Alphaproteobacteria bacterium]MBU0798798.1 UDP-N-acetylglucosamine 1-carboxyvinyltransferase [Alphaproteobacteria bacterium]MBU0886061.1 UDP-N-acetylglucosamine 1-carboxyvinyltransferase [Alphaproteobacteria bacterium]MBU1812050.1 UDP-N-acetylglucosamine 1-carboxyvinyltransferase [Alphaproteobacteria bacterium]MBU2089226.1 UDP-N-acetylglucosamine 1-carboxyvinyltransferase [Alphaproteobacteria bacterium]
MDKIRIRGGRPLHGRIQISGAKNAGLPLMAACLLSDQTLTLSNLPALADIATMATLLEQHGVTTEVEGENGSRTMRLNAGNITSTTAPYDLVRKMRASVLVLGPILARFGEARVSLPGGCAIGNRPVDLHVKGLTALGAEIVLEEGYIHAKAPKGLKGGRYVFPQVSVGATENLMMAACLAEGETTLVNAAREPEVNDLAHCLNAMGGKVSGIGTDTLTIQGVAALHGAEHRVVADRIEAGTYAIAAVMTDGELELTGVCPTLLEALLKLLTEAGAKIDTFEDGLRIRRANGMMAGVDVMTEPYPGFPTDLQAQIMALMTVSKGAAMVTETIFENRFMHVPELCRMGANINVHHSSAMIRGVEKLKGAPVMATDLRASVSMVLAGLAAEGETIINRVYHLDRGYERLEAKLAACGADIERLRGEG